jgi:hypothetical protein
MKSSFLISSILILSALPMATFAQDDWKLSSALTTMTGNYKDAMTMNNQHGSGLRLTGDYQQQWGITAVLQSTRINMMPMTQTATQDQDNWLLSGYLHAPSAFQPGRWTLQLDGYRIHNDAKVGNSDGVRVIAPQVSWLSAHRPLKLDLGFARSSYRDNATIHQFSAGIGFGFNSQQNWAQIRGYAINNLDPRYALGYANTRSTEFKLTQFLPRDIRFAPTSITLGVETGKKIFGVDMLTQTVYNLPMVNKGSENIAATWQLTSNTDLTLFASKTRYFATATVYSPYLPAHNFTLRTLSAQLATAW